MLKNILSKIRPDYHKHVSPLIRPTRVLTFFFTILLVILVAITNGVYSFAAPWLALPALLSCLNKDTKLAIFYGLSCITAIICVSALQYSRFNFVDEASRDALLLMVTSIVGLIIAFPVVAYLKVSKPHNPSSENYEVNIKSIIENIPNSIIISDQNGIIMHVNSRAEIMFGYTLNEMVGMNIEFITSHRFQELHTLQNFDYSHAENNIPLGVNVDIHGKCKDGTEIPIEMTLSPVVTENNKLVITEIRDITDKKRAEKLIIDKNIQLVNEKLAKEQFLTHISHELRMPLNGIIAMTKLLMQSNLPDEYKEQIDILNESEEHMLSVVNHILDFSKIESGKISVVNKKFNINDLVNKMKAIYTLKVKSKNIKFNCTVSRDLPEYAIGDAEKISAILTNLLDNALNFTQIGSITLTVSLLHRDVDDNYILFDVTDTGVGLQPDALPHLFTPYLHDMHSNSKTYGHTGLGLAISKNLVDVMGGSIHAESLADGSRFYFTIPLIACDDEKSERSMSASQHIKSSAGETLLSDILLVEDNQLNQRTLKIVLDKFGFTVTIVSDGRQALEMMAKYAFRLILMDCQMPNMDGYTTSIEIRKLEYGRSQHTPIIGVTAHADPANRQKCLDVGMDDFVTKPLNIDEFHHLLLQYILK